MHLIVPLMVAAFSWMYSKETNSFPSLPASSGGLSTYQHTAAAPKDARASTFRPEFIEKSARDIVARAEAVNTERVLRELFMFIGVHGDNASALRGTP